MADLTGILMNRYQIIELLGSGGMAKVYKAYDERLGRYVAIKSINMESFADLEDRQSYIKRFNREIRMLANLSHPHIMDISDFGEFEGEPFFVAELIQGGNLRDKMEKPIHWKEAAKLLLPVAHGLVYAHQKGFIHRDIKPDNILIRETGEPVLCDFGLAKPLEDIDSYRTRVGVLMGTPEYMAPEQMIDAKNADARADVFSLGVVLYEMLTGHRPYTVNYDLSRPVLEPKGYADPQEHVSDLPSQVQYVLFKALSLKPKNRFRDMEEFLQALNTLIIEPVNKVSFFSSKKPPKKIQRTAIKVVQYTLVGTIITAAFGFFGLVIPALLGMPWAQSLLTNVNSTPIPSESVSPSLLTPAVSMLPAETPINNNTPNVDLPSEITTPLGTVMRLVQAGEFTMGSSADDAYAECQKHRDDCIKRRFEDEESPQKVFLDAFYMDQYEVTNGLYKLCVDVGVCQPPQESSSSTIPNYYGNSEFDNYPVIFVTWNMAKAFCEWNGTRLPTEAEWEKAARGTDGRIYPWGGGLNCDHANYGQGTEGTCVGDTTPVGSYRGVQSIYGLYDMAGNVNEWVSSLYQPYPYNTDDGRENPDTPGVRVFRGGSWDYSTGDVRSANRNGFSSTTAINSIGFRCARDP